MRTTCVLPALLVAATLLAFVPAPAAAQMMEPITLVGFFDRTSQDHPNITDEITVSTDGKTQRKFGIVQAQSQIGVSGTEVFKRSLKPVINLRGPKEMTAKLDAATPVQQVKMIGMLQLAGMGIILNGVEVAPPPPVTGTGQAADGEPAKAATGKE